MPSARPAGCALMMWRAQWHLKLYVRTYVWSSGCVVFVLDS